MHKFHSRALPLLVLIVAVASPARSQSIQTDGDVEAQGYQEDYADG